MNAIARLSHSASAVAMGAVIAFPFNRALADAAARPVALQEPISPVHEPEVIAADNNWRAVSNDELQAIWDKRTREGTVFNGHTMVDLIDRYGVGNVKHVAGETWHVRGEAIPYIEPAAAPVEFEEAEFGDSSDDLDDDFTADEFDDADEPAQAAKSVPAIFSPSAALADRAALTRAIEIVTNVVERRNTIPILSNLAIVADGPNVRVVGTDLDMEITVTVPAAADAHFAITLPAHTLKDLVKKATSSEYVGFAPDASGNVKVDFERVNYRLQSLPITDYPNLDAGKPSHKFMVPGKALVDSFGAVAVAISTEETRYYLNGVYWHHVQPRAIDAYHGDHGALRMVATDGHRLMRQDIPAMEGCNGMPGVIIPRKTVALLQKLLKGKACPESVAIEMSDTKIVFMFDGVTVTSKLVDGTFPDYQRVIPTGNDRPATFNAADLAEGVRAVSLISSERGRAVKFTFEAGKCMLAVNNPDSGSANAELAIDYASDYLEIGFNAKYVEDVLATAGGEEITFTLADAGSPTLITTPSREGWLAVLMPMRV